MKIVYCGHDFFGDCLEEIVNKGHEVLQLFTQASDGVWRFNDKVTTIAQKHNIPVYAKKPTEEMIIDLFKNKGAELLVSAGFKYIIPTPEGVGFKGANVHPALLPVGRGPWPIPVAILKGEKNLGITIHQIMKEMDSGDILMQEAFPLSKDENMESISAKCKMTAKKLIGKLVDNFDYYWQNKTPQGDNAEIWVVPTDDERTLSGEQTVEEFSRTVRAFGKIGAFLSFDDRDWFVYDATCWKEKHDYAPGSVVQKSHGETVLALKDGFACLRFFNERIDFPKSATEKK